ncbi:PAS domain S-box protein [Methanobacterium sp. SMA-27]|uniref:PAS domain-containing response regulator n=1 Tax=Methanobacterium sp. SMA-27 TaxID=1495336 RepID=UPI00064F38B7|nr:PAS domain S-box protein [Methanobacterium sp. SMA-27]
MTDKKIHILLIEDNPGDALIINEMLKEVYADNFVLDHFKRIKDGLEHVNEDFDIMLLDLNLPDSQGIGTFNTMNMHAPEVPIIILTGLLDEDLAINIVSEGAQDYLVKGQIDKQLLSRSIKYSIERKHIEIDLRKSEEKYRSMVEKLESGLFLIDSQNKINYVNSQMADMLGYKMDDLMNQNVFNFINKSCRNVFKKHLKVNDKHIGQTYEIQFLNKEGTPLWVLVSTSPLHKVTGEYIGAISIMTDITARKGMEKSIMDAMVEKDKDFFLIMGNMVEAVKPLIQTEYVEDFQDKFT